MLKIKLRSIIVAAMAVFPQQSVAWDYNYSVDQTQNWAACPTKKLASTSLGTSSGNWNPHMPYTRYDSCTSGGKTKERWYANYRYYFKSPSLTCYRFSCYNQAMGYLLNAGFPVQPLTENVNVIKDVFNRASKALPDKTVPSTFAGSSAGAGGTSYPKLDNTKTWGTSTTYYPAKVNVWGTGNADSPELYQEDIKASGSSAVNDDIAFEEPGAGTSSMQGILWGWRMLSDKWKGVWRIQSSYEAAGDPAIEKRSLMVADNLRVPSSLDAKHLVLISDGDDNDGPSHVAAGQSAIEDQGVLMSSRQARSFTSCDAHKPAQSVTPAQYQQVCKSIAEQGIQIHIVVYGYGLKAGSNLQGCIDGTNQTAKPAKLYDNVDPGQIKAALRQILAQVATDKIRLLK